MAGFDRTESCRWRVPVHLRMVLASFATGQNHHSFLGASLFLSLSGLNPAWLLHVGRWSFDLISSEILPSLLITNCFTLNTQQHKISFQSFPSTSHCLPTSQSFNQSFPFFTLSLFHHSPSSLLHSCPSSIVSAGVQLTKAEGREEERKEVNRTGAHTNVHYKKAVL